MATQRLDGSLPLQPSPPTQRKQHHWSRRHLVHAITIALGYTCGHVAAYCVTKSHPTRVILKDAAGEVVPGERALIVDRATGQRLRMFAIDAERVCAEHGVHLPANFAEQNS